MCLYFKILPLMSSSIGQVVLFPESLAMMASITLLVAQMELLGSLKECANLALQDTINLILHALLVHKS